MDELETEGEANEEGMKMYFNTNHEPNQYLPVPNTTNLLSPTAPPFIPPQGMPPLYTPTIPPSLLALAEEFIPMEVVASI